MATRVNDGLNGIHPSKTGASARGDEEPCTFTPVSPYLGRRTKAPTSSKVLQEDERCLSNRTTIGFDW